MKLIRNETYKIIEGCGEMILEGIYLGRLTIGHDFECFVFKRIKPGNDYKYFGANWKLLNTTAEDPHLYLAHTHSGNSPDKLKTLKELCVKQSRLDFVQ